MVVPGKCCNDCKFCVSQMHDSPYEDRVGACLKASADPMESQITEQDYADRLAFARDNGCNVAVLTGRCEPAQRMDFLRWFDRMNKGLPKPFRWLELQTSGVLLDDPKLVFFRQMGIKTIALSVANLFDDADNCQIIGVKPNLKFQLKEIATRILAHRFNLRICLNLVDNLRDRTPSEIIGAVKALGANQVTFRQMFTEKDGQTEKDDWIREHALTPQEVKYLSDYVVNNGRPLEPTPFGAMRYAIQGMSTVTDSDCMSLSSEKSVVRYLVLGENCTLRTKWDEPGSVIF